MEENSHKAHRKRQAGKKAEKKKKPEKLHKNPKAFAMYSAKNAQRLSQRASEMQQKKMHVPLVDRTPLEPPPFVIAVVGPPGTGKSTLIRSLVKRYTRQNLQEIQGPISIVTGKKMRITLFECGNDLNSMIDIAKVADLVLLTIDASFGFEMETFEFLNILQSHGFPKVMGVLTHLDSFKDNKAQRQVKKKLKHRFWTEIYQGAKLFYLSGLINGRYGKTEILNLSRFISVMKFRPLIWRNSHSYMMIDRVEDMTAPHEISQNSKCDRQVCLYGFVRGIPLKHSSMVHVPGMGDFKISEISQLADPCPLPTASNAVVKGKKRTLNDKERVIYAPMCDVGGILYDKDAVYVDMPKAAFEEAEENDVGDQLMKQLNDGFMVDEKLNEGELKLFKDSAPIRERRPVVFANEIEDFDSDEESDEEGEDVGDFDEEEEEENEEDEGEEDEEEEDVEEEEEEKFDEENVQFDEENVQFDDSDSDHEDYAKQKSSSAKQKSLFDEDDDDELLPIERQVRRFNPLKIPKSLQANLPFASKPKQLAKRSKPSYETKRAVILDEKESKAYALMQQIATVQREKAKEREAKQKIKRAEHEKQVAKVEERVQERKKEYRKKQYLKQEMQSKRSKQ